MAALEEIKNWNCDEMKCYLFFATGEKETCVLAVVLLSTDNKQSPTHQ